MITGDGDAGGSGTGFPGQVRAMQFTYYLIGDRPVVLARHDDGSPHMAQGYSFAERRMVSDARLFLDVLTGDEVERIDAVRFRAVLATLDGRTDLLPWDGR